MVCFVKCQHHSQLLISLLAANNLNDWFIYDNINIYWVKSSYYGGVTIYTCNSFIKYFPYFYRTNKHILSKNFNELKVHSVKKILIKIFKFKFAIKTRALVHFESPDHQIYFYFFKKRAPWICEFISIFLFFYQK